jgi:hypothetical protein
MRSSLKGQADYGLPAGIDSRSATDEGFGSTEERKFNDKQSHEWHRSTSKALIHRQTNRSGLVNEQQPMRTCWPYCNRWGIHLHRLVESSITNPAKITIEVSPNRFYRSCSLRLLNLEFCHPPLGRAACRI